MNIKKINISKSFYHALVNLINHDGVEHAGYMAFLTLLSIFPFLVFFVALAGFLGETHIGEEFMQMLLNNLPPNISYALKPRIDEIMSGPPESLMTVAIVGAIWTASSSVEGLRTILNRIYNIYSPPAYIFRRLLSILQFLSLTISAIIGMLILLIIPIFANKILELANLHVEFPYLWSSLRYVVASVTLFILVITLYYIIPNTKLRIIQLIPGAIITVSLWFGGGYFLSLYFSNFSQVNLIYGSLGGVIATILYFYIVHLIFIYGAEFNYLLTNPKIDD